MDKGAALEIGMRRAAFNRVLAAGDLASIGPILTSNTVLITGADSALLSGRNAQLAAWKRDFADPDRSIYAWTPKTITPPPSSRSRSKRELDRDIALRRPSGRR